MWRGEGRRQGEGEAGWDFIDNIDRFNSYYAYWESNQKDHLDLKRKTRFWQQFSQQACIFVTGENFELQ